MHLLQRLARLLENFHLAALARQQHQDLLLAPLGLQLQTHRRDPLFLLALQIPQLLPHQHLPRLLVLVRFPRLVGLKLLLLRSAVVQLLVLLLQLLHPSMPLLVLYLDKLLVAGLLVLHQRKLQQLDLVQRLLLVKDLQDLVRKRQLPPLHYSDKLRRLLL